MARPFDWNATAARFRDPDTGRWITRVDQFQCGTTNIDFSHKLARQLDRIRTYRKTDFDIAPGGLTVTHAGPGGSSHKEKKIELPESWVSGFHQVQSTMAMGLTSFEVAPIDLLNIIRFLRRKKTRDRKS